jgi:hypothetical protein
MARRPLHGCRFLLGALLLLLALFPVLQDMARPILLIAAVAGVFVAGVVVVEPGRRHVRTAVTLAVIQIGMTGLAVLLPANTLGYTSTVVLVLASTSVLIVYCIYCVLRYVLKATSITRDQVYAGICVYLMLGFAFGCIYYLVEMLDAGGFAVNSAKLELFDNLDLMYFSFVTLATLGYGDITPVARVARALAQLEALAGTVYMAVFMAKLVSMAGGGSSDVAAPEDGVSTDKPKARIQTQY